MTPPPPGGGEMTPLEVDTFKSIGDLRDALIRMGPQTVTHLVILSFIIMGNILYFMGRRKSV